jgi:hypothetical protein
MGLKAGNGRERGRHCSGREAGGRLRDKEQMQSPRAEVVAGAPVPGQLAAIGLPARPCRDRMDHIL